METSKSFLKEVLPAISTILDYQDNGNLYHAWRVSVLSFYLAELICPKKVSAVFYAALLHDIGAMGFREHVTDHPTKEEQEQLPWLKNHTIKGAEIISEVPGFNEIAGFILNHHEWWNGEGYPNGLEGDSISIGSQIIRIADSFDLFLRKAAKPGITDIYDYFRTHAGGEYKRELWPAVLDLKNKNGGVFFHELLEDNKIPLHFSNVLNAVPEFEAPITSNFVEIVLRLFGRIVDTKHPYTSGHTERVAKYSEAIARKMGLKEKEIEKIRHAAYLHDLGKTTTPLSILDKPGKLNQEEIYLMKRHPVVTMEIIDSISSLRELSPLAGYHHERHDGTGYPDKLKGDEIPIGAAIIGAADTIDAMTSDRAYRKALTLEAVISELRLHSGTQFNPRVADAVIAFLEDVLKGEKGLPYFVAA